MNLYLVTADWDYDALDSAVVWAESAAVAKRLVREEAAKPWPKRKFQLADASDVAVLHARKINLKDRTIVHTHVHFG